MSTNIYHMTNFSFLGSVKHVHIRIRRMFHIFVNKRRKNICKNKFETRKSDQKNRIQIIIVPNLFINTAKTHKAQKQSPSILL